MERTTQIFVDGNCIVCDFEISHYKKIAPDIFEIVDISHPKFEAKEFGLSVEAVNSKMHVRTPDGELKIGIDAFAHIWDQIERYRFAARIVRIPIIRPIAKMGYEVFAVLRPLLPKKRRRTT